MTDPDRDRALMTALSHLAQALQDVGAPQHLIDRAVKLAADVQLATHNPSAQGDGDNGASRSAWEGEA